MTTVRDVASRTGESYMCLPQVFCWTKFGTEAGEPASTILQRKEVERAKNGGIFLWGIGTSIRPSLLAMFDELATDPVVVFSPMLARPAPRDVAPAAIGVWSSAAGLDGRTYDIPAHSTVTSGANDEEMPQRHFALVCYRERPIADAEGDLWLDEAALRNIRTGSPVGASQVTSVVRRDPSLDRGRRRYRVAFDAVLRHPYLAELRDWVPFTASAAWSVECPGPGRRSIPPNRRQSRPDRQRPAGLER